MIDKIWKTKEKISPQAEEALAAYSALTRQLLFNRDIIEPLAAEEFLNTDYSKLPSPFLFKDMQKAVDRIWLAIQNGERITIYSDYDADAVTANAVLQQTFGYLGMDVASYIPDRFSEGYGINLDALSKIKDSGAKLIVTVDCGTNSTDAAEWCRQNQIDLIITDHHEIIGKIPDAFALINPKNPADNYPFSELTGVGVAYKMACAILKNPKSLPRRQAGEIPASPAGRRNPKLVAGSEKWLLDLVAIGTVADCHSLIGENRILVKYGLKVLAKTRWVGLRALMSSAGLFEDGPLGLPQRTVLLRKLDTYTLGFIIAPRLNAAGRIEHADIALNLLLETDPISAQQKAFALQQLNEKRQNLTESVLSEAREQVLKIKDRNILLLTGDNWPKGVVGLIAGRIAEEYYKPTIVLSIENDEAIGSARSVGDFSIIEALKFAREYLTKFGGHEKAAGLTLAVKDIENFYKKILEYSQTVLSPDNAVPVLELEAELALKEANLDTLKLLSAFEPFGMGNPHPKFLIKNVKLGAMKQVGSLLNHLQMNFSDAGFFVSAIGFNLGHFAKIFNSGDTVDIACQLLEDGWNGRKGVKLKVVDLRAVN